MTGRSKKSFVFHTEWIDAIKDISPEKGIQLICLLNDYSCNEIEPEIEDPIIRALFKAFKPKILEDIQRYKVKCQINSENAKKKKENERKRSQANATDRKRTEAKQADNDLDNDYDNDNENDISSLKKKNKKESKKFTPPSVEEIAEYCKERDNKVDPEYFFNHYQANGWYRGNTKMKDWKATVRTWETRKFGNKSPPKNDPQELDEYMRKVINGEEETIIDVEFKERK